MTHAQAIEMILEELLKDLEYGKRVMRESGTLGAPDPDLVVDAVVLPQILNSIIARHNAGHIGEQISGPITNEEMKRIADPLKKVKSQSKELHAQILMSKNRDRYQQLLEAMIDPKTTAFIPDKRKKSFASKVAAFFGFGK